MVIGASYHHLGQGVVRGNNLLLDEIHTPRTRIPLRMAPLVLFGTLATHLFGGSAGREGTAVQMGGTLAGYRAAIQHTFEELSAKGFRTLGLATKAINGRRDVDKTDKAGMPFLGFISLFDAPKVGI